LHTARKAHIQWLLKRRRPDVPTCCMSHRAPVGQDKEPLFLELNRAQEQFAQEQFAREQVAQEPAPRHVRRPPRIVNANALDRMTRPSAAVRPEISHSAILSLATFSVL
jgi:hypothetical protein